MIPDNPGFKTKGDSTEFEVVMYADGKPKLFNYADVTLGEMHPELKLNQVYLDNHFDNLEGNYD